MSVLTSMFTPAKVPDPQPAPVAPALPTEPKDDKEAQQRVSLARKLARQRAARTQVDVAGASDSLGAPSLGKSTLGGS